MTKIASTKTNGKKLQLAKETLRALNGAELGQVAGGSNTGVFAYSDGELAGCNHGSAVFSTLTTASRGGVGCVPVLFTTAGNPAIHGGG